MYVSIINVCYDQNTYLYFWTRQGDSAKFMHGILYLKNNSRLEVRKYLC